MSKMIPTPNPRTVIIMIATVMALWAGPALDANPGQVAEADVITGAVPEGTISLSITAPLTRVGVQAEIKSLLESRALQLAQLHSEFRTAVTEDEALDIQRRIEATELASEVAVLRAQIPYAASLGRSDVVAELEATILALQGENGEDTPRSVPQEPEVIR